MNRFFELARRISFKSSHHPAMGAIITFKGKVLGLGYNSTKTHPRSNHSFSMTHAELSAILNARLEDFSGCEIYIYRELKNGQPAPAKPCIHCSKMLKSLNFKNIHYSDYESFKSERI